MTGSGPKSGLAIEAPREKFVVVHNGRRDDYQVAQALAEAGMLERLVTDFYGIPLLPTSRYNEAIPRKLVSNVSMAAGRQLVHRVGPGRQAAFDWHGVHADLGTRTARLAAATKSGVLAYSGGTALEAFSRYQTGRRVLFVFHPLPVHEREVLETDLDFCRSQRLIVRSEADFVDAAKDQETQDEEILSSDLVLTASTFTRSGVVRRLGLLGLADAVTAAPIPYGAPTVGVVSSREPSERTEFLFLGQGVQRKGLHHLLLTWRDMEVSRSQARLTVVASSPDPAILALAKGVPTIRVLPRLPSGKLKTLMLSSDVLVLPSLVEGFGLVITEALAHGLHVIASTHTGLPDLRPEARVGQIIIPGDLDALERSLRRACNPDNRSRVLSHQTANQWPWERFRAGIVQALSDT